MSEIKGKPVYGTCECKEKVQVLSVDQVVDLIQQMASNEWQVPADYIPKTSVNGIIEQHQGNEIKLWIGTKAEFNEWTGDKTNVFTILTDDPITQELTTKITQAKNEIDSLDANIKNIIEGKTPVSVQKNDGTMAALIEDANGVLKYGDTIIPKKKTLFSGAKEIGNGNAPLVCYPSATSIGSNNTYCYKLKITFSGGAYDGTSVIVESKCFNFNGTYTNLNFKFTSNYTERFEYLSNGTVEDLFVEVGAYFEVATGLCIDLYKKSDYISKVEVIGVYQNIE